MLIDIDTGTVIDRIPYRSEFDALRGRLSEIEFDAMIARINELIDEGGSEIVTAGWLPGSDWAGTPFEPIYAKAAREDFDRSAMFFGQLVWYTVMTRPEGWASGRYSARRQGCWEPHLLPGGRLGARGARTAADIGRRRSSE